MKKKEVAVILSDELKEDIKKADLSGYIDLIADLIARERILEITVPKDPKKDNPQKRCAVKHD